MHRQIHTVKIQTILKNLMQARQLKPKLSKNQKAQRWRIQMDAHSGLDCLGNIMNQPSKSTQVIMC